MARYFTIDPAAKRIFIHDYFKKKNQILMDKLSYEL